MEPHIWIWVWVLLTVIMAVGEWLEGGGFLLPFAVGSAAAAGLEFAFPGSSTAQWVAFLGLASILTIFIQRRKLRMREVMPKEPTSAGDDAAGVPLEREAEDEPHQSAASDAR